MLRQIDFPVPENADPVEGLSFARMLVDIGPPAAAMVTFYRVRRSGLIDGEVVVQIGDAIPEEFLSAMKDQQKAEQLRNADDRGDLATRFLTTVCQPGFVEKAAAAIAAMIANGEISIPAAT